MDADRQLPLKDEIFLDHVAHFVADADSAAKALTRSGFAPTPVSLQTNPGPGGTSIPAGTGNITAMLTRGYIENLFKTSDTPLTREFDALIGRYEGVHLMAFTVADAVSEQALLAAAGFRVQPILALRRPVATVTGQAEAAFTVARVEPGQMREGRIQFLTHHTEDSVWQKRWLSHPNGARALIDAVVVVADVDEAASRYSRFLGRTAQSSNIGKSLFLDRGGLQIMDQATFARSVPAVPVPDLPFIGAYAIEVESILRVASLLRSEGMMFEQRDRMLFVPFPKELGTGAWVYVENPRDLPWRAKS